MAKTKSGTLRPFSSSLATEIIRNTTYTSPKFLFPALKRSFVCTPSSSPPSSSGSSSLELDPHRQVRVSHILLPPGSESTIEDFKSQILDGNATLESLAKDHSTCPSGASRGGDIGWIPKGRTVPEFELASYSTPKGSLSTCSTQFGVHLIQVTEERIAVDVGNCSVHEFAEILSSVSVDQDLLDDIQFVDVREPHEVDIVSLPHFQVLPLGNFQDWAPRLSSLLDPTKKTYVLCHHGMRSMQASQFFLENGFSKVWNISGGIDAYARGVDNNLQRY
jgi:rhodanese-related sulfurtransferase